MNQKRQIKSENALTKAPCSGTCSKTKCWYDSSKQEGSVFSVFDPIQGPVDDCYFIAALASAAWIDQTKLSRYGATGDYKFKSGTKNISSKEILYNNNVPTGAQFGQNNYYWPLWYEKAYAKLMACPDWTDPNSKTKCPDVCQLSGGAGLQALTEIAWWYTRGSQTFTIKYSGNSGTLKTALDKITTPGSKAINPAVAWTNSGTSEISADHTYSYLGYVDKNPDYYIVLRNPCKVEPTTANVLKSGKWPNSTTGPIDFSVLNDGIFALKFQAITTNLTIGYMA
jgi:hypothetical protein